jgi:hypothetical protein
MRAGLRSLNVALAAAMVLGEALRQTGLLGAVVEESRQTAAISGDDDARG